ncbi:MAG: sulfatase/phosphatase domain-containing protein, partial [Candidatus Hermodarchaeota archaeon]
EIVRKELSEYYGAINRVDLTIERIYSMLEDTGLNNNTLFIYTTDHGSPFPRAKCTLYDPGIETILLMHQPNSNLFSGGKVINNLLINIDLLPTLIEHIGGEIPKNIEGKSFLPILKQEQVELRSEIYLEKTYHEIYDPIRGIRTNNYKYIRNFERLDTLYQMPQPVLMAPSGKFMKNYYNSPRPTEELYDLGKDSLEKTNVINITEYQEIVTELRKRLFNWLKATNDPILKGKIPKQTTANFKN